LRCQQDLVQWTINQQLRRTSTILREKNLPSVLIDHYTFHPAELMARVGAKLRSVKFQCDILNILQSNGVKMDLQSHKVSYAGKNEVIELDLTPIEFKILQIFLEKPGVAMDRNYILDRVWGKEVFVYPRSVDTHICKLKKKLKNNSGLISSVHGKGYRFGLDRIAI